MNETYIFTIYKCDNDINDIPIKGKPTMWGLEEEGRNIGTLHETHTIYIYGEYVIKEAEIGDFKFL